MSDAFRDDVRAACAEGDLLSAQGAVRTLLERDTSTTAATFVHSQVEEASKRLGLPVSRLAMLTSFTASPFSPHLTIQRFLAGEQLEVGYWPYNQWYMALAQASELVEFDPDTILLLLHLEDVAPLLAHRHLAERERLEEERTALLAGLDGALSSFRGKSSKPIVLSTFIAARRGIERHFDRIVEPSLTASIERLNNDLADLVLRHSNISLFDYAAMVTDHGRLNWFDPVKSHLNKSSVASRAWPVLAEEVSRFLTALHGTRRKVVAVDLDDTLWGGIVGEDGVDGIEVSGDYPGNAYESFQSFLSNLRASGVLLSMISKNNVADAKDAFESHPKMPLGWDDFSSRQVNWEDKVANLRAAAAEINVGVDSFVFADDNPMECELVRTYLPEVATVHLSGPPSLFPEKILAAGGLDAIRLTDEDFVRAHSYLAESNRQTAQATTTDMQDFLAGLQLCLALSVPIDADVARVVQLFAKTNQFNLTTKRYTHDQVLDLLSDDEIEVVAARLSDRFGDYGLIGVAVLRHDASVTEVDSLLMSCRVLGRKVEDGLLAYLEERARIRGSTLLKARYLPTSKNGLVSDLYPRFGFVSGDQDEFFVRDLTMETPLPYPSHLQIEKSKYE